MQPTLCYGEARKTSADASKWIQSFLGALVSTVVLATLVGCQSFPERSSVSSNCDLAASTLAQKGKPFGAVVCARDDAHPILFSQNEPGRAELTAAKQASVSTIVVLNSGATQDQATATESQVALVHPRSEESDERSALFTRGAPAVRMFNVTVGTPQIVGLTHESENGQRTLLALIVPAVDDRDPVLNIYWYEPDDDNSSEDMRFVQVSGLEHLFAYARRLPMQQRLGIHVLRRGAPLSGRSAVFGTQAQALAELAMLRERAANRALSLRHALALRRWLTVSMSDARDQASMNRDKHDVAVTVAASTIERVTGATVTFERYPHLICSAKVESGGMARCRLYD